MKRISILGFVLFVMIFASPLCEASTATVTGWATADNFFWVWDYKGAGNWDGNVWYPVAGWDNWKTAHKIYGDVEIGETNDLYFAVKNVGTGGLDNPAGFLAGLTASSGYFKETGTSYLLSDTTHWEVHDLKNVSWTTFPNDIDPTTLTSGWLTPAWYAKNTQGAASINPTYKALVDPDNNNKSIWYQGKGGKISNIDNNAEWIWTTNNFNSNMDNYAILRTQFTVIPEPTSMLLFGIGALGFGVVKRKKGTYKKGTGNFNSIYKLRS